MTDTFEPLASADGSARITQDIDTMKINLQLLHLCSAIFHEDPLKMLVGWSYQTKGQLENTMRRMQNLKGVMPDAVLEQVVTFIEELHHNKGGSFQFIYSHKPDFIDPVITKWTALLSEDASWLNDQGMP